MPATMAPSITGSTSAPSVASVLFMPFAGTTSFGRVLHMLTKLGCAVGFIVAALLGVLWYFQERLLFHPHFFQACETPDKNPEPLKHPGQMGMMYEDVTLTTSDEEILHAWLIKQPSVKLSSSAPTLVFFQGNAGNMGLRLANIQRLYEHCHVNILIISYRGYGYSTGVPCEDGVYRDAEAALRYVWNREDLDRSKLFIFGRSIGGAIALDLALKHPEMIRGVIVENTFTSLEDMAVILFPFLKLFSSLVTLALRVFMDSLSKVPLIPVPVLYISGLQDTLVPPSHVASLYNASVASSLRRLYTVSNGTHNATWMKGGTLYYKEISKFIEDALEIPSLLPQSSPTSLSCPKQKQDISY